MMNHIVVHCPRDALDKLEEISYLIKNGDYIAIEDFLKMNESKLYAAPSTQEMRNNTDSVIASSQKFFKKNTTVDEEGNEVPAEMGTIGNIPDL